MILGRLGRGYCKKNRMLEFLAKIFGYVPSAHLSRASLNIGNPEIKDNVMSMPLNPIILLVIIDCNNSNTKQKLMNLFKHC